MTRFKIRRETGGAIVYDRQTRNYARTERDLFGPDVSEATILDVARDLLGVEPQSTDTLDVIDNGLCGKSELSAPIAAYLEISNVCNLKCRHCYKAATPKQEILSLDDLNSLVDQLAEMGVLELRLTGYEPVISRNFRAVAARARSHDLYLVLNTNGFYGPKHINEIMDIGFDEVIVSIEGREGTHDDIRGRDSYRKAVTVLETLRANGNRVRINTVVSRRNAHELVAVGQLADRVGAYVNFLPLRTGGRPTELKSDEKLSAQDMLAIVEEVQRLRTMFPATRFLTYFDILDGDPDTYHPMWLCDPCPARKNVYISSGGDVYPCDFLSYLGDLFRGGNVLSRPIAEIWHDSEGLRRYWTLDRSSKCSNCELLYKKCYGGCASETLAAQLVYDDPLCFKNLSQAESH